MVKRPTQEDVVAAALERLGGIAHLSQLYVAVDFEDSKTQTPDATIRRIVRHNDGRIKTVKEGLYCLAERYAEFASKYDETQKDQTHNHAYYQGLLLDSGNRQNYKTYVARQDRNREFLPKQKLGELATLETIYPFGYPGLIKPAITVDVIWFNERKMPERFYEVEMTTDIHTSIRKFYKLRDFGADFVIVAPKWRRDKFNEVINEDLYSALKDDSGKSRVEFKATEDIYAALEDAHSQRAKFLLSKD